MRTAFILRWLTSVAGHPVPLTPTSLGPDGEVFADGLVIGAVAFVLADELGHVALGRPLRRARWPRWSSTASPTSGRQLAPVAPRAIAVQSRRDGKPRERRD